MAILALSVWLTSVVFVEPRIGVRLTPSGLDPQIWAGLLGVLTLFLSILQLRVDWKGQSDGHRRSASIYSKVKAGTRFLLESEGAISRSDARDVLVLYEISADVGCAVKGRDFLVQKGKHLQKVAISRYLDKNPGASVLLLKARMWWTANVTKRSEPVP
jgi:hypothetical protein